MSKEKDDMLARLEAAMKKSDFNPDTFADGFSDAEKQTLASLITDVELEILINSTLSKGPS